MKTEKFNYNLPEYLIAQYPAENRVDSRLLACIDGIEHKNFQDVLSYMDHRDLLVVNKTSVIPARLFGEKSTGGKVEILLERFLLESPNTGSDKIFKNSQRKYSVSFFL